MKPLLLHHSMTKIAPNSNPSVLRVLVIRHGQTDHNVKKILQGHLDIDINQHGYHQANLIGKYLQNYPLDYIISSDLVRCINTSKQILEFHDLTLNTSSNLREREMGKVQGMYLKDALLQYGENFRNLGETKSELSARVEDEWNKLIKLSKSNNYKNVAIVTHGGVITGFINYLYKSKDYKLSPILNEKDLKVPFNTSVAIIDIDLDEDTNNIIQKFGETDHLGGHFENKDQLLR